MLCFFEENALRLVHYLIIINKSQLNFLVVNNVNKQTIFFDSPWTQSGISRDFFVGVTVEFHDVIYFFPITTEHTVYTII